MAGLSVISMSFSRCILEVMSDQGLDEREEHDSVQREYEL